MSDDSDSENEKLLQKKLQRIADILFEMDLEEDDVDCIINDIYEKVTGEAYESDEEEEEPESKQKSSHSSDRGQSNTHSNDHGHLPPQSSHAPPHSSHSSHPQSSQPQSTHAHPQSSKINDLTTIISKATTKVNNHKQLDCILLSGGVQTQVYQHVLYCTSHNLDPLAVKKLISQKLKVRSAIKNDHLYLEGPHTRKELEKFYVSS
jgi:hypothetical protein